MKIRRFSIPIIVSSLIALNAFLLLSARELTLRSISYEMMDLDARSGSTARTDAVGNKCALLKVELPDSKAVFQGNVVGNVDYKGNEH